MLHDLTFGSPLWLWGLLALPVLVGVFVWAEHRAANRLVRLIREPRLRAQLTGAASAARRRWRYGLLLTGLAFLFIAMAAPRLGFETVEVHRRGLDLIVIVDVSKSMLANDLAPDRLTRAKLAVQDLVGQLPGDRVGLVAFAGNAFLQAPLTIDYDAVLSATSELDVDLIPLGGTNIGGAIDLSLEAFGKGGNGNRALLLLSDGEPTSDTEQADGLLAAKRATAAGVRIFTVGFGTPDGALIPLSGGRRGEFVRDENGQIVRTRLNESALTEIARTGNGFYLRFTNGEAIMRTIIQDGLSKLRAGEIDAKADRRPIERYQWPLGAGLLFLALAALPGERRRYRAPTAIGGVTPGARAVPVRRTTTAAVIAAFLLTAGTARLRGEDVIPVDPPATGNASGPLALYKSGKYDEAFRAFTDLAKENPDQGNLQFDAGASAYMGKQYEEALEAFGKALTAPDAGLRAKSHYNFGNTLYRRGTGQKEKQARITDWRNAIQHYNATLDSLKNGKIPDLGRALADNTTYNRDFVQHRLDEELKPPPPTPTPTPTPTPSPTPKKDDKKDQKKQPDKSQDKDKDKGDQQDNQSGQQPDKQPQPQSSQDKGGSSPSQEQNGSGTSNQPQDGNSNQPPKPDSQQPQPSPDASPAPGGKPEQQNPQPGGGKPKDGQHNPDQGDNNAQNSPQNGAPDPNSVPNQEQPRQQGDFQSKPEPNKDPQAPPDHKGENGEIAEQPAKDEYGKMSAAQARALLDSLKNEDARVMLNSLANNRRHRDDNTPAKDW